jgi:hypothetical protein
LGGLGAVAVLAGIEVDVVSGVMSFKSSGASD